MRIIYAIKLTRAMAMSSLGPGFAHKDKLTKVDEQSFTGKWESISCIDDGVQRKRKPATLAFADDMYGIVDGTELTYVGVFKLDATKAPKTIDIDMQITEETLLGIYEIKGDTLTICLGSPGDKRPSEFESRAKSGRFLMTLKRLKR